MKASTHRSAHVIKMAGAALAALLIVLTSTPLRDVRAGAAAPGDGLKGMEGDAFEVDDTPEEASWIGVGGPAQRHTIHDEGDEDWARFYATPQQIITILTENLDTGAATRIEVFPEADTANPLGVDTSALLFEAPADGFYLVRVTHASGGSGPDTGYDLRVFEEIGGILPGSLVGTVTMAAKSGEPIGGAAVRLLDLNIEVKTDLSAGSYLIPALPADGSPTYTVTASALGFLSETRTAQVHSGELTELRFLLEAEGSPILQVMPSGLHVGSPRNERTLSVENTGSGVLEWTVSMLGGVDWITVSMAKDGGDGAITVVCGRNPAKVMREGGVRVEATNVTLDPVHVLVRQGRFGDISGDDIANALDVALAIRGALALSTAGYPTDLDGDGVTNAVDVQLVILAALE